MNNEKRKRKRNVKKALKIVSGALSVSVIAASLCGCTQKEGAADGDKSLTCWMGLSSNISSITDNYGNTPFSKEYNKRTGVNIEYLHPVSGQEQESLSLMIASDDLPDMIYTNWVNYQGGPSMAINDGVIVDLAKYKKEAKNYFNILKNNPDYDRAAKTDEGAYYGFAMINDSNKLLAVMGPAVRKDWLDELGLKMPETVDDWENMLEAFKDKKGATAPFSFNYNTYKSVVFSLFEARYDPYVKDGKVVYGPAQPEFKKALETLHRWFEKGLLDKNIFSVDKSIIDSQILNDKTGATVTHGGSGIGLYQASMASKNPNFNLMPTKLPTYKVGDVSSSAKINSRIEGGALAITTACQTPEVAAKALDYLYSDEGSIFANFGTEGETFTYENNEPKYTELITNNPNGWSMSQALGQYVKAGTAGGYVVNEKYIEQYYNTPQQQTCFTNWTEKLDGAIAETLPPITPTTEESSEYSSIMNEVTKYKNQMIIKFITGAEPIENFDNYVKTLNNYGLQKAMDISNRALERYNSR